MNTPKTVFVLVCIAAGVQGQKKGFSIAFNHFKCGDFEAFGNMNWWYDWHLNPFYYDERLMPNCSGYDFSVYDSTFASMAWGWNPKKERILRDDATVLLGYNEPNYFEQANLTPEIAAHYWPEVEALAAGRPIVSPSAAPCSTDNCSDMFKWFDEFYGNCTNCIVNYTATHVYVCKDNWLMGTLNQLHKRYKLPIWLTEFACPSENATTVLEYMKKALPRLEKKDFVHRYSWYTSRITVNKYIKNSSSLLEENTSTLTPLGEYYVDYVYSPP